MYSHFLRLHNGCKKIILVKSAIYLEFNIYNLTKDPINQQNVKN